MARRTYKSANTEVYRVVIESNGLQTIYGPYSTLGAGKSLLTLKLREAAKWNSNRIIEGRVEVSTTVWTQAFPV